MDRQLFALEHYQTSETVASPDALARPTSEATRLVAVVHLPADDTVLALVEAPDEATATAAGLAAGWRVDRVSPATLLYTQPQLLEESCAE
jgi:hypothetical protein